MTTAQTCACTCATTDSALSITANVISIVTLVYVLLIGIGYRCAVCRGDKDRSSGLYADAVALRKQIDSMIDDYGKEPACVEGAFMSKLQYPSEELASIETLLAKGLKPSDSWYLIYRQVQHARKKDKWRMKLESIHFRVKLAKQILDHVKLGASRMDPQTVIGQEALLRSILGFVYSTVASEIALIDWQT